MGGRTDWILLRKLVLPEHLVVLNTLSKGTLCKIHFQKIHFQKIRFQKIHFQKIHFQKKNFVKYTFKKYTLASGAVRPDWCAISAACGGTAVVRNTVVCICAKFHFPHRDWFHFYLPRIKCFHIHFPCRNCFHFHFPHWNCFHFPHRNHFTFTFLTSIDPLSSQKSFLLSLSSLKLLLISRCCHYVWGFQVSKVQFH